MNEQPPADYQNGKPSPTRPVAPSEKGRMTISTLVNTAKPAPSDAMIRQRKVDWARQIWDDSWPLTDTLAENYLLSRGLVFTDGFPEALRFHPSIPHEPTRQHFPAMIAAVRDDAGQLAGIHRTYLAPDGSGKAQVAEGGAKRMLGDCFGAYVRLSPTAGRRLVLAEAVETALSVMLACPDLSVWAAMALGNMKTPVPQDVREVILCADGDNRDNRTAERLLMDAARAHQQAGHIVLIARPPYGMDFNDLLLAG